MVRGSELVIVAAGQHEDQYETLLLIFVLFVCCVCLFCGDALGGMVGVDTRDH